jgi:hypothetical protein
MPKRIIGNPTTTPMAIPDTIVDLGTFEYDAYTESPENNKAYVNAIDNAMETGIYKLCLHDIGRDFKTDAILIVTKSDMDRVVQTMFTPYRLYKDSHSDITLPIFRVNTMNLDTGNFEWSPWKDFLEDKVDKEEGKGLSSNDFTDNYKKQIEENSYHIGRPEFLLTDTTDNLVDAINEIYDGIYQTPITEIPTTLERNKRYNFGEVTELALAFPTIAYDGDVIYATFITGKTATSLTIDTTNTCDIEFIPEVNTGYEVYGTFNDSIWIVNYSEYTVSEG